MGSRFDYDTGEEGIPYGLWLGIKHRAIHGRPGQTALAELEQALLTLPTHRLITGAVKDGPDVCAVGALALFRLNKRTDLSPDDRKREEYRLERAESDYETLEIGVGLGLTETLSWVIAEVNDERFATLSPEGRYTAVLGWVRDQLTPRKTAV